MRLTRQSTHRTSLMTGDACPCCYGSLEGLRRAMSEASRALADSLPLSIQAQVAPALDTVRLAGREVMAELRGVFGRVVPAPQLATFQIAIEGLSGAIEARTPDLPACERDALSRLQASLDRLHAALTTLGTDLADASRLAGLRADRPLVCEPVGDQHELAVKELRSSGVDPRAMSAASQAHPTLEGVAG